MVNNNTVKNSRSAKRPGPRDVSNDLEVANQDMNDTALVTFQTPRTLVKPDALCSRTLGTNDDAKLYDHALDAIASTATNEF